MDFTTRLSLQKPDPDPVTGDFVDVSVLNQNADVIDQTISFTVCTSAARPATPFQGQAILETDTGATYVWGGSSWLPLLVQNASAQLSKLGLGAVPSGLTGRLVRTWGVGGGAVSQVSLQTSDTASGHRAVSTRGGTDTQDRWWIDFDGHMQWAPADAGGDVVLYRGGANKLQTDDQFTSVRASATDGAFSASVSGNTQSRLLIKANGELVWGDGAVAGDVTLRRASPTIIELIGTLDVLPTPGGTSTPLRFNHGYSVCVDNAGAGAAASRIWVDGPAGGECVIGPRGGSSLFDSIRLRTNRTTASAANVYMDASHYVYRSTSSIKYKVNIQDADWSEEQLLQLRPVRFQDKREFAEQGEAARHYVGLVAEEVAELGLTEFVHYDEHGQPDGVQYDRLSVALLTVVKNLVARVSALEERTP